MLDDRHFIKDCIENKPGAIDRLYKRYAPMLFGICLRYAASNQEAEDILHDGFVRIIKHLHEFRGEGSFEGWLKKIMVNTAINQYRKNQAGFGVVSLDDYHHAPSHEDDLVDQIAAQELFALVSAMPEGYRQVFNLFAIEGYRHKEISEMLGISESTSKTQFLKARKYLIQQLMQLKSTEMDSYKSKRDAHE